MQTRIRLFVLDDDEAIRLRIEDALRHADIKDYELFESHEDFFDSLDEFVNIAIIDHSLVGISGMKVMEKLLETNPLCYIIIISGNTDPNLIIQYQEKGSSVFILKDHPNFTGKLVVFVHKAYKRLKDMLDFKVRNIEAIANIKLPTDHEQTGPMVGFS